jgi:multisubunit Na+/H+ antiporter MnhF subunit
MTEPLAIWIGAIVTLAVFSYLARDNLFYRLVQQAALGVTVGIMIVVTWQQVLYPMWLTPIAKAFQGTADWKGAFWLLALVPGSLWYFQLSKRWFWVSTLVSGLFVGVAAGLAFKNQILLIMPQIGASLKPLNPLAGPEGLTYDSAGASLNNLIFLVALLTALLYFFFSVRTDSRVLSPAMRTGRLMIMVALGAMFGNTVMTRMAYLIERLQFLYEMWLKPILTFHGS